MKWRCYYRSACGRFRAYKDPRGGGYSEWRLHDAKVKVNTVHRTLRGARDYAENMSKLATG